MAMIHEALVKINREITAVGRDRRNATQGFNFRGIDDLLNHTHQYFAEHGVVLIPTIKEHKTQQIDASKNRNHATVTVGFTLTAEDGSVVVGQMVGEGLDGGDKATSKAVALATKYFLITLFTLPTQDPDPDALSPGIEVQTPANKVFASTDIYANTPQKTVESNTNLRTVEGATEGAYIPSKGVKDSGKPRTPDLIKLRRRLSASKDILDVLQIEEDLQRNENDGKVTDTSQAFTLIEAAKAKYQS